MRLPSLLLCACQASAFVFLAPQRARWSMPPQSSSHEGLGHGISFAVDPGVCDVLRYRFVEYYQGWRTLASCEDVHDAISRALASWSVNNKRISFYNVTNICGSGDCSNRSELYITASRGSIPNAPLAVATTTLELAQVPPYSTNGQVVYTDASIVSAQIELLANDDMCWYMDSNTCSHLLDSDFDVEAMVVGFYLTFLTAGIILLIYSISRLVQKLQHGRAYRKWRKATTIVLAETDSVLRINLVVFFLLFPNVFYFQFFRPCFTCYSFEAAVLHHVGLALGLEDVSVHAPRNLQQVSDVAVTTCVQADLLPGAPSLDGRDPLVVVQPWEEDPLPINGTSGFCDYSRWWECENLRFSAMLTPDPLHALTCPTKDDLAGLSILYPSCGGQVLEPSLGCVPTSRNSSWWRFMLIFGIPTILVLVLLPVFAWFVRKCIKCACRSAPVPRQLATRPPVPPQCCCPRVARPRLAPP